MNESELTVKNLRDMGGLVCPDGAIKAGMIYRGPKLVPKTEADIQLIDSLQVDSVIDLRSAEEVREQPDRIPPGSEYVHAAVLTPGEYKYIIVTTRAKLSCLFLKGERIRRLTDEKLRSYEQMPFAVTAYSEIFRCMDEGRRFVFHCTEGKDRTGIAAMFIECALGRSPESVMREYMLSNELRRNKDRSKLRFLGASERLIEAIAYCESTHEELLRLSVRRMEERSGSVMNFLRNEYGVTEQRIDNWKRNYLE